MSSESGFKEERLWKSINIQQGDDIIPADSKSIFLSVCFNGGKIIKVVKFPSSSLFSGKIYQNVLFRCSVCQFDIHIKGIL